MCATLSRHMFACTTCSAWHQQGCVANNLEGDEHETFLLALFSLPQERGACRSVLLLDGPNVIQEQRTDRPSGMLSVSASSTSFGFNSQHGRGHAHDQGQEALPVASSGTGWQGAGYAGAEPTQEIGCPKMFP